MFFWISLSIIVAGIAFLGGFFNLGRIPTAGILIVIVLVALSVREILVAKGENLLADLMGGKNFREK